MRFLSTRPREPGSYWASMSPDTSYLPMFFIAVPASPNETTGSASVSSDTSDGFALLGIHNRWSAPCSAEEKHKIMDIPMPQTYMPGREGGLDMVERDLIYIYRSYLYRSDPMHPDIPRRDRPVQWCNCNRKGSGFHLDKP